jgi:hypothetical protein
MLLEHTPAKTRSKSQGQFSTENLADLFAEKKEDHTDSAENASGGKDQADASAPGKEDRPGSAENASDVGKSVTTRLSKRKVPDTSRRKKKGYATQ